MVEVIHVRNGRQDNKLWVLRIGDRRTWQWREGEFTMTITIGAIFVGIKTVGRHRTTYITKIIIRRSIQIQEPPKTSNNK